MLLGYKLHGLAATRVTLARPVSVRSPSYASVTSVVLRGLLSLPVDAVRTDVPLIMRHLTRTA